MREFVPSDSPLLNPPSSLALKQRVAIDGVRLALDMLGMTWYRLEKELAVISTDRETPLTRARLTSVYTDAWIIVDVVHRLRLILIALPGLKHSLEIELAVREFAEARAIRDAFQHIDKELKNAVDHRRPLWGTITWLWTPPESVGIWSRVFTIVIGGIRDGEMPTINPLGKSADVPLGLITVSAFGRSLELSKLIDRVQRVATYLDSALRQTPNPLGGMADALMSVDVHY